MRLGDLRITYLPKGGLPAMIGQTISHSRIIEKFSSFGGSACHIHFSVVEALQRFSRLYALP
jgi:hypothetical protein